VADVPLGVEDLLPISMTKSGESVQMAVKMRRARIDGRRLRYVGGVYEPTVEEPPVDETPTNEPPDPGDLPPAPDGCRWQVDLFGNADPVLVCG
jgi:hypothetical protein